MLLPSARVCRKKTRVYHAMVTLSMTCRKLVLLLHQHTSVTHAQREKYSFSFKSLSILLLPCYSDALFFVACRHAAVDTQGTSPLGDAMVDGVPAAPSLLHKTGHTYSMLYPHSITEFSTLFLRQTRSTSDLILTLISSHEQSICLDSPHILRTSQPSYQENCNHATNQPHSLIP